MRLRIALLQYNSKQRNIKFRFQRKWRFKITVYELGFGGSHDRLAFHQSLGARRRWDIALKCGGELYHLNIYVFFISLFVGTWTPLVPIRHRDIIANMTSNSFIAAVIRANKMLKCYLGAS